MATASGERVRLATACHIPLSYSSYSAGVYPLEEKGKFGVFLDAKYALLKATASV
jgi:hypothetical protein